MANSRLAVRVPVSCSCRYRLIIIFFICHILPQSCIFRFPEIPFYFLSSISFLLFPIYPLTSLIYIILRGYFVFSEEKKMRSLTGHWTRVRSSSSQRKVPKRFSRDAAIGVYTWSRTIISKTSTPNDKQLSSMRDGSTVEKRSTATHSGQQ